MAWAMGLSPKPEGQNLPNEASKSSKGVIPKLLYLCFVTLFPFQRVGGDIIVQNHKNLENSTKKGLGKRQYLRQIMRFIAYMTDIAIGLPLQTLDSKHNVNV